MAGAKVAAVVVDLGFGDAGKGTTVDWLVRDLGADLVVRFNGGAQAAHNVVLDDGRHHTFSQFGAATFVPHARTHLSRHVVVHPTGLLVEARKLAEVGVHDALERLTMSDQALVVTPYQQAAARLRELLRGRSRHGSCGVGVGETVKDSLEHPDTAVRARDLSSPETLRRKLAAIRERKVAELDGPTRERFDREPYHEDWLAHQELRVLGGDLESWVSAVAEVAPRVVPDESLRDLLSRDRPVVFEGAHGTLIDEWRGFHPHTTWSTCTTENALALLKEHGWDGQVRRLGVLRTYAVRHGPGPFPTERKFEARPEPHNTTGQWQGAFRTGPFDFLLSRYAIAANGGVDGLVLTHLDQLRFDGTRLDSKIKFESCGHYRLRERGDARFFDVGSKSTHRGGCREEESDVALDVRLGPSRDLSYQESLGAALGRVEAVVDESLHRDLDHLLASIYCALGVPVVLTSWGPTASAKRTHREPEQVHDGIA